MANIELPDFMKYKDKFTANGFVEKIQRVAKRAGSKLVYAALVLYYTLESDEVSLKEKAIIIGALGYLISPLDVVPDAIPIAGLGDDLGVLIYVLHKVWGDVSEDIKEKAKDKLATWFDTDEIEKVDSLFNDDPSDAPV
ncbi:MAG: YkvA family protein [Prevotella sp.]|nr:YkvA family protein [Bacteroidales bacterium]MDD6744408.1 YkvA family protein [Bacteroidales bacterium]MDY3842991.1 YkvA family protein [Prevotella sp.]